MLKIKLKQIRRNPMKIYKEVHLDQGSEEWLLYRRSRIMATDSAKIMGENPWASPLDCYEEKINGKETFITSSMKRGIELEPHVRNLISERTNTKLSPKVFESTLYPFMGASLDAISDDLKTLYEIKVVGEKTMQKAINNDISMMYIIQCHKHMIVLNLQEMHLFFYYNDFITFDKVIKRDEKLVKKIIKADENFWESHILPKIPPEKYGEDYEKVNDESANDLAVQWKKYADLEKDAHENRKNIEKRLEKYTNNKNTVFPDAGIKYEIITRKGSVDWNQVRTSWKISEEDIEKFRKETISYVKISEI